MEWGCKGAALEWESELPPDARHCTPKARLTCLPQVATRATHKHVALTHTRHRLRDYAHASQLRTQPSITATLQLSFLHIASGTYGVVQWCSVHSSPVAGHTQARSRTTESSGYILRHSDTLQYKWHSCQQQANLRELHGAAWPVQSSST